MKRSLIRLSAVCAGSFLAMSLLAPLAANAKDVENDSAVAGISVALNRYYAASYSPEADILAFLNETVATSKLSLDDSAEEEDSTGVISVNFLLNIRTKPSTSADVIGSISNGAKVTILDEVEDTEGKWYKVLSGDVEGFVKADYVLTGEDAKNFSTGKVSLIATVATEKLNVRDAANIEAEIIGEVFKGETYEVIAEQGDFVQIRLVDGTRGFIAKEYVEIAEATGAVKVSDGQVIEKINGILAEAEAGFERYKSSYEKLDLQVARSQILYVRDLYADIYEMAARQGLSDIAASAAAKRDEANSLAAAVDTRIAEFSNPDAGQVNESSSAATEAPTHAPAETTNQQPESTTEAPTTPAVTLVGIRAYYTGAQKYVSESVSGSELRVDAVYSDNTVVQGIGGWGCAQVGRQLAEGTTTFYVEYQGQAAAFEVNAIARPVVETPPPVAETQPPVVETPPAANNDAVRNAIAQEAISWMGRCNYVYGQNNLVPGGQVDCSAFTQSIYKRITGITLSRSAAAQFGNGRRISYEELRPGDLVFYYRDGTNIIGHVGIYVGNGAIVDAANEQLGIRTIGVLYKQPAGYISVLD